MRIKTEKVKKKYQSILDKNKSLLNLKKFDFEPLISIIIINKDGLPYLKELFKDFKENIVYSNYEILVVDNASTDRSIDFLKELSNTLPLKIIENKENKTFSKANNQAVREARGEFILLLNNDIEPTYGWLNQMVQLAISDDDIGAVGAKLVYPYEKGSPNSFKIQHAGIFFKNCEKFICGDHIGRGRDPFDSKYNKEVKINVTAAVLLVRKELYLKVGLDENYEYGYEDVDFNLKLIKMGFKNVYCPDALLFHHESVSVANHKHLYPSYKNLAYFQKLWRGWLRKKLLDDQLDCTHIFTKKPLKIIIVEREVDNDITLREYVTAREFGNYLKQFGWDVDYNVTKCIPKDVDILISFDNFYEPDKIICKNPSLIKIAWIQNNFNLWIKNPQFKKFDFIFSSSENGSKFIKEKTGIKTYLLPFYNNTKLQNIDNQIQTLKNVLKHENVIAKIVIKIAALSWKGIENYDDYHIALGLKREFERKKCKVLLQIFPEWDTDDEEYEVVIVLRGLKRYKPKRYQFNIMWNISHPDLITKEEYEEYDFVFVASDTWTNVLKNQINVPVDSLLHCTDPELFYPKYSKQYEHELLFMGNINGKIRIIIEDSLHTNKELSIKKKWDEFANEKQTFNDHIPNISLHKAYFSSKILLNYHCENMKEKGFISNRIFDGFASGAFIISDEIVGARKIFGDALITYNDHQDLNKTIDYYLEHNEERKKLALKGRNVVLEQHTFKKRVEHILKIMPQS